MRKFEESYKIVIQNEGGFVNDPKDKGGMTYMGICRKLYPSLEIWDIIDCLLELGKTPKEIDKALKNEDTCEIKEVYIKNYWEPVKCETFNFPMYIILFDTAVNMGCGRAKQFLKETENPTKYLQLRINYYKKIVKENPSQEKFLKGWLNRIKNLCSECCVEKEYLDF